MVEASESPTNGVNGEPRWQIKMFNELQANRVQNGGANVAWLQES